MQIDSWGKEDTLLALSLSILNQVNSLRSLLGESFERTPRAKEEKTQGEGVWNNVLDESIEALRKASLGIIEMRIALIRDVIEKIH